MRTVARIRDNGMCPIGSEFLYGLARDFLQEFVQKSRDRPRKKPTLVSGKNGRHRTSTVELNVLGICPDLPGRRIPFTSTFAEGEIVPAFGHLFFSCQALFLFRSNCKNCMSKSRDNNFILVSRSICFFSFTFQHGP